MTPSLPTEALKRLGRTLRDIGSAALDHADMPTAPAEPTTFDQEARAHLAAIERKTAPRQPPRERREDPA